MFHIKLILLPIAAKLLDEGNTKENVDNPTLKALMEQLYFKGVKRPSFLLEHASIRRKYTSSFNVAREELKSSMIMFSVNLV